MAKPDMVKQAIRDRKLIKEVAQRNVIPKIRNILLQSMLNQSRQQQLTAQQVRKILGVQMPKVRQSGLQADGVMSDRQIQGRNNQKVDMNMTDIGRQKQNPNGVVVRNVDDDVKRQKRQEQRRAAGESQTVPTNVDQISKDTSQLRNDVNRSDDPSRPNGRKKQQVRAGITDNPTQNIPTSTQQNVRQKKKEMQDMQRQNKDQWINESMQRLDEVDVFQNVGLRSNEPGRPDLSVIPQTFTDSDEIQVQNPERSDHIQQPSAVSQGATNNYESDVVEPWQGGETSSYKSDDARRRMDRIRKNSPRDAAARQTDKQDLVQMLDSLNQYSKEQQDATQVPTGKKVITQDDNAAAMNQVKLLKLQNQKLVNEVKKLKMLSDFIMTNFSSLNQNKIKWLVQNTPKLNQSARKQCMSRMLSESKKSPDFTQKKIFESNAGKFNKIRARRLNNKAERSRDYGSQDDRLAELAGLSE